MNPPKIVYIAGPYGDAGGYLAIDRNIAQAREAADALVREGIGYICPHLNSAHFEAIRPEVPVDFWYEMDIQLMRGADAVLVLSGYDDSKGTQREIAHAKSKRLPIFYWPGNDVIRLREWAKS